MNVAAGQRQYLVIGIRTHDHAGVPAEADCRGTFGATVGPCKNDINAGKSKRFDEETKDVVGIIDETSGMAGREI
jgi:hypothetical protein